MKAVVIYYSYTGKTKELAQRKAQELQAELFEVTEQKRRGTLGAYAAGSFAAMLHKKAKLVQERPALDGYDRIVIAAPIWACSPAPAFNNIVEWLPAGKEVELLLTSGSGNSAKSAAKSKETIANRGCKVISYVDIKTAE